MKERTYKVYLTETEVEILIHTNLEESENYALSEHIFRGTRYMTDRDKDAWLSAVKKLQNIKKNGGWDE